LHLEIVVLEMEIFFTVTVVETESLQTLPFVTTYFIVVVPALIGVTIPLILMIATVVVVEPQTPPLVASLKGVVLPIQTEVVPVMAATVGKALTVTVVDTESLQPLPFVTTYFMVVVPALTGVTIPLLFIVATLVVVELHTPPLVASLKVVVLPIQTEVVPVMAATVGKAFIVAQVCV
jgi:hypothetical protein